jgi:phage gp16-like protein
MPTGIFQEVKMSNTALAKIHIAKKELKLDDQTYRDVLERVTGKRSSKGLSAQNHAAILKEFKRLGWQSKPAGKRRLNWRPTSKKPQVRKIFKLWTELKKKGVWKNPARSSLLAFVKNQTGVADPEWLDFHQASDVIEVLKKMGERS